MKIPGYQRCVIGGGRNYRNRVPRDAATIEVSNWGQLRDAFAEADGDDIAYLTRSFDAEGEISYDGPDGFVLASDRGIDGARGATIDCDGGNAVLSFDSFARVTGLDHKGPREEWLGEDADQKRFDVGIRFNGPGGLVDNCELRNWTSAAVASSGSQPITLRHNYGHDNPAPALGYVIACRQNSGQDVITDNYFNRNRHSIECESDAYGYVAKRNVQGPIMWNHAVDCHGGPNSRAARRIVIERNTCLSDGTETGSEHFVVIRGEPREVCIVRENQINDTNKARAVEQTSETKYGQRNTWGSAANKSGLRNMRIEDNVFGDVSPSSSVGAGDGQQPEDDGIEAPPIQAGPRFGGDLGDLALLGVGFWYLIRRGK